MKNVLLPAACLLACALLMARCDSLTEPVAIAPDALQPVILGDLNRSVNEDETVCIAVEAENPDGDAANLEIVLAPPVQGGTVEAVARCEGPVAAARPDPQSPPRTTPAPPLRPRDDAPAPKAGRTRQEDGGEAGRPVPPKPAPRRTRTDEREPAPEEAPAREPQAAAQEAERTQQAGVVGGIRYRPAAHFFGTETFGVRVRDRVSRFESRQVSVTVTVLPMPDPPEVVPGVLRDTMLTVGRTLTKDLNTAFTDPDCRLGAPCPPLRFAVRAEPPQGVVDAGLNANVLEVTALNAPGQQAALTVTADDGDHEAATTFTVTVQRGTNQPPQKISEIPDRQLAVGERYDVDLTTIFVDPDGDPLTFADPPPESSDPVVADAALLPDGRTLRVTMKAVGFSTITVTASDGRGGAASETFSVSLEEGVNAVDDAAETLEDRPVAINVLRNDFDTNNRPLSIFSFIQPDHGGAVQTGDSTLVYTPAPGFSGTDRFDYVAQNDVGDVDRATVRITVLPKNRPPEFVSLTGDFSGAAGQVFTFEAQAVDPDGDVLLYTWNYGDGTSLDFGENLTRVSHVYDAPGDYTLLVRAEDDDGAADTETRTVTVGEAVNTPPVFTSTPVVNASAGQPYQYAVVASDADADTLTITAPMLPAWLALEDHGDGTATLGGTPVAADAGGHAVTLRVSDGRGGSATQSFTLTVSVINQAPRVDRPLDDVQITVGTSQDFDLNRVFLDPDPGDALGFAVASNSNPGAVGASVSDSTLTLEALVEGVATVVVEATDPGGLSVTDTVVVTASLNNAPVVGNPGAQQHSEAEGVALAIIASDPDGDPFGFAARELPPDLAINRSNGIISGILATDAADGSPYATEILVTDNRGGQTLVAFTWTVTNPNPAVQNPGDQSDEEAVTIAPLPIIATDDDATLTYDDAGTLPPDLTINANGRIRGTLATDAAGPSGSTVYPVTVTAADDQGGQGSTTFNWTVANPPPTVQDLGDRSDDEGVTITPIPVTATDDDSLTYTDGGTLPPGLSIDAAGLLSGTLATDAAGPTGTATFPVVVTVADGQGGQDTTAFAWSVVNPVPVLTPPGNQSDTAGVTITPLQILANDDDTLAYDASGLPPGLAIDAAGLVSGTIDLNAGAVDPYAVEVTVDDGQGGRDTTAFAWSVVHPAPTLTGLSPDEGTRGTTLPVTLTGANFISGVSTVDFGPNISVSASVDDATQITATVTIGAAAAAGDRDVTVTNAAPGGGVSAPQPFTVNVAATAVDDTNYTATTGLPLVVPDGPTDLLANDDLGFPAAPLTSFGGGDLGGLATDHAAGTTVPIGATGSITVNDDGSFSFTSDVGFTGAFDFRYRLTNAAGASEATVRIIVNP